ncbi:hypothetical protein [Pedobacter cryoconitis]|uniref:hypothetical protein n=1 Tax=Pedobacter cryoconitis TaxID=188932 RepID=UPI001618A8F1|nr:hypothetical protein [Pedobacter cryoconitis]MBB5646437.1 hypothetical protein [Pedobacter cryoconitis]
MNVRIIVLGTGEKADALIIEGKLSEMPSIGDNWKFDFKKQLKNLKDAKGYLLVREDSPQLIEGCMIFQEKTHDHVAGCLIAYAFKLSLMRGIGEYKGALYFKIGEEKKENEIKLMTLYSTKYNAYRLGDSNIMAIYDEDGKQLIDRYLNYTVNNRLL